MPHPLIHQQESVGIYQKQDFYYHCQEVGENYSNPNNPAEIGMVGQYALGIHVQVVDH